MIVWLLINSLRVEEHLEIPSIVLAQRIYGKVPAALYQVVHAASYYQKQEA